MPDRTTHDDDDLFDPKEEVKEDTPVDDDATTDTADDTDEQETDSEDEQKQPDLDNKGKEAEKQADKWSKRTQVGEELPHNLLWLKKEFPDKFNHMNEEGKTKDLRATIREEMDAERDEDDFKAMRTELNDMELDDVKRQELDSEYKDLRESGLSKKKALEVARKSTGILSSKEYRAAKIDAAHELAPQGYYKKQGTPKTKMSELEEEMSGNLPKGYHI